jgi:hypothetical protein
MEEQVTSHDVNTGSFHCILCDLGILIGLCFLLSSNHGVGVFVWNIMPIWVLHNSFTPYYFNLWVQFHHQRETARGNLIKICLWEEARALTLFTDNWETIQGQMNLKQFSFLQFSENDHSALWRSLGLMEYGKYCWKWDWLILMKLPLFSPGNFTFIFSSLLITLHVCFL